MHFFGTFNESSLRAHPTFAGHGDRYTQADLISRASGAVHTGLSIAELGVAGVLHPHIHSYEEGFYILSGDAVVDIDDIAYQVGPGDFGCVKVGQAHALRAVGSAPVRWLQMAAPQPKPQGAERDTFFLKDHIVPLGAPRLDLSLLRGNLLGHFDEAQIPPLGERQSVGPGLEGVFLKWLIDEAFGARHHRLLFIEYQPGVRLGLHDHTFEEAYFILKGEVEATVDGTTYIAKPGDIVWTGVGCVHGFANVGTEPVLWLETFAPQPPKENVFRFVAEWETKANEIER
jgi:mannose-6-phosphate isomerase-like protein (cupin superfamily)